MLIGCAAARSQETSMKWTPVDGLDRSLVLGELPKRLIRLTMAHVPYHELVVVAT